MKILKKRFLFAVSITLLFFLFISNEIIGDNQSALINIQFLKPLRVNEINFYRILLLNKDIQTDEIFLKLYNPSFTDTVYSFKINRQNSIITKRNNNILFEGYFFLPNVIPVGKGIIEIKSKNSATYKEEISFQPEVVFHGPMFQKGFLLYASESEMGMRRLNAEAYPVSQICFSNTKKKSFFFFKIKLGKFKRSTEFIKLKLRIMVKQRILDEIIVDSSPKEYVYCLSKDFIGSIEWLKIRFETYTMKGEPVTFKETAYDFEYLSLIPFNGVPRWINSFLKDCEIVEKRFRCQQE